MLGFMNNIDPVELSARLVRIDTMNPPGGEAAAAALLAPLLESAGYAVQGFEHAPGRTGLVATLGEAPFLAFSGHLDTVPAGQAPWSFPPLCGEVRDGRLLGRGSADMKSGVAALVAAAVRAAPAIKGPGLCLILTASEETGCEGAAAMAESGMLPGPVLGLVVAEPTGCLPALGHKGFTWFSAVTRGRAAHGSMPQAGDNAIYKAARAALALEAFQFPVEPHPVLGRPTLNLGTIRGGTKINMVPDRAEMMIDARLIPGMEPEATARLLAEALGPEVELSMDNAARAVWSSVDHPWLAAALDVVARVRGRREEACGLSYFTDAASLGPALDAPVLLLGPGEAAMAHQTDETCPLKNITQATEVFTDLALAHAGG